VERSAARRHPLADEETRKRIERLEQALAESNDVVIECLIGLAKGTKPTRGYAFEAVQTLARASRRIGQRPMVDQIDISDWEDATP
jgi:hypothetical protein